MSDELKNTLLTEAAIIAAMQTVEDPEIPVNLYDLGLIYEFTIQPDNSVSVLMTLTTPNCPVAEMLPTQIREAVAGVAGVKSVDVELTWEPAWTGDMMTEDARLQLDMMGISWKEPHASVNKQTPLTIDRKVTKK